MQRIIKRDVTTLANKSFSDYGKLSYNLYLSDDSLLNITEFNKVYNFILL